jgi:hypothetical protein
MLAFLASSVDSFFATLGLGTLSVNRGQESSISCWFGLADGMATLAAVHLNSHRPAPFESFQAITIAVPAWILFAYLVSRHVSRVHGKKRGIAILTLPLLLSLDNLTAPSFLQVSATSMDTYRCRGQSFTLASLNLSIFSRFQSFAPHLQGPQCGCIPSR